MNPFDQLIKYADPAEREREQRKDNEFRRAQAARERREEVAGSMPATPKPVKKAKTEKTVTIKAIPPKVDKPKPTPESEFAARSAASKRKWEDPEYRRRVTASICERWKDPARRQRHSEKISQGWKDPVVRERMTQGISAKKRAAARKEK